MNTSPQARPAPALTRKQAEYSILLAVWQDYHAAVKIKEFAGLIFWAERAFQSRLLALAAVEIMDADGQRGVALERLRMNREFMRHNNAMRLLDALRAPVWLADAAANAVAVWKAFKQTSLNLSKWGQR